MEKNALTLPTGILLQADNLPLPPSANNLTTDVFRKRKDGKLSTRRISTDDLVVFQWSIKTPLRQAQIYKREEIKRIREYMQATEENVPLKLEIVVYLKDLWGSDTSNRIKALEDVILYQELDLDDKIVCEVCAKKLADPERPRCKVRLSVTTLEDVEW